MAVGWLSPPHTRSGAQFNYLEIYHIEDYQFSHCTPFGLLGVEGGWPETGNAKI